MKLGWRSAGAAVLVGAWVLGLSLTSHARRDEPADPLPSWNTGPTKKALLDFVARVTSRAGPDFAPAVERIAVFDNDGTLWAEQPVYFQVFFALDRVKALA